jgi:hypothetical protein
MDFRIFKLRLQGSNPLLQKVFYIIEKILKLRCLKWARMTHLDMSNTSYDQKKSWKSNWQFDPRPLKVGNPLDFLACKRRTIYRWKAFSKGYNLTLDLIVIEGLHAKLWAPKVARVLVVGIPGLPLGSLGTKCHLDVAPMERCKEYYKGEGDGFPKFGLWWVLWVRILPMARPNTKSAQTMH